MQQEGVARSISNCTSPVKASPLRVKPPPSAAISVAATISLLVEEVTTTASDCARNSMPLPSGAHSTSDGIHRRPLHLA